jgi:hypothetical protein
MPLPEKFKANLARRFPDGQRQAILAMCTNRTTLATTPVTPSSTVS